MHKCLSRFIRNHYLKVFCLFFFKLKSEFCFDCLFCKVKSVLKFNNKQCTCVHYKHSPGNFENLRGKKPLVHIYKVFRVWEVLVVWQLNYNVLWLLFAVTWYLITASLNYHTISFFLHLSNIAIIINDKRPLNQANWNYMYVNKETEVSSL